MAELFDTPRRFAKGHSGPLANTNVRERIELRSIPEPNSGCWLWLGSVTPKGYGVLSINDYPHRAHRVSYEDYYGEAPGERLVCHTCDNPMCVNPEHLFLGSSKDNMADKRRKGRAARGEKQHASLLSEDAVRHILTSDASGVELAEHFGVHKDTVYAVRRRRNWAWVNV